MVGLDKTLLLCRFSLSENLVKSPGGEIVEEKNISKAVLNAGIKNRLCVCPLNVMVCFVRYCFIEKKSLLRSGPLTSVRNKKRRRDSGNSIIMEGLETNTQYEIISGINKIFFVGPQRSLP